MMQEQKDVLEGLKDYFKVNFEGDVLEEWGSGDDGRAEGMTLEAILKMVDTFVDKREDK